MTQNEKELLLKDLCSRLPYGVMAKFGDSNPSKITNITQCIYSNSWFVESEGEFDGMRCKINNVKPYLFPISNMTKEQVFEINEILGGDFEIDKYGITDLIRNRRTSLSYLELNALFEYFNKNYFDYRGLIEKGLAIDATDKNVY